MGRFEERQERLWDRYFSHVRVSSGWELLLVSLAFVVGFAVVLVLPLINDGFGDDLVEALAWICAPVAIVLFGDTAAVAVREVRTGVIEAPMRHTPRRLVVLWGLTLICSVVAYFVFVAK